MDSYYNIMCRVFEFIRNQDLKEDDDFTVVDITCDMRKYISLWRNSDILNAAASIEASKIHNALMATIAEPWSHEDAESRRGFSALLRKVQPLLDRGAKFLVATKKHQGIYGEWNEKAFACVPLEFNGDVWELVCGGDLEDVCSDVTKEECIGKKYEHGIILGTLEYREGSCNGSSGYYHDPTTTKINPDAAKAVRADGLIPVAIEIGSYHENWFKLLGVYPEKWEDFKTIFTEFITEDGYKQV